MTLFFVLHIIFLLIYAGFVAALIWHYREYALPNDPGKWIIGTFLVIMVMLAVFSIILFIYAGRSEIFTTNL